MLSDSVESDISQDWLKVKNVLVMRLDNIGDVIMTSPALQAIKENLPHAQLTLMASPGGSLAAPLLPWVDQVLTARVLWQDLGRLAFDPAREWDLVSTLKAGQFDAAIIFTSFNQSPHPPALLCALADIPIRVGESKEKGGVLTHEIPSAPDDIHQVERNLRLIESVGLEVRDRTLTIQIPDAANQSTARLLIKNGLTLETPFMVLNPWTSCQSRNYDAERFAIAARQLAKITGWKILITGVEKDREHSGSVIDMLGEWGVDLIGKTDLSELATLIAHARLLLSNNTSTMHIADATRTPSVILFAGTELECQWQPRSCQSHLLRQPTECSPCYAFTCPYNLECLDIEPERVVSAGLDLIKNKCNYST